MSYLPVIVGFGGVNPAGRSSFHHAYRRLVIDHIPEAAAQETWLSLATMMGLVKSVDGQLRDSQNQLLTPAEVTAQLSDYIRANTLIRRINHEAFDVNNVPYHVATKLAPSFNGDHQFVIRKRHLPEHIPVNWRMDDLGNGYVQVNTSEALDVLLYDYRCAPVQSAGQLPTGFQPGDLYQSRNHPRNLQMSIYSASDCLGSTGLDWNLIRDHVAPDQIAVYAGNSIGQMDDNGFGGMLKSHYQGKRITSKQLPLGYGQMPADFINAYVLGSVGATGASLGACASFLYNLQQGVDAIRSGKRKVVLVGGSDAPILPEVIEGFRAMGALAEDKDLRALDNLDELSDEHYRRACRPFSTNCGFTIGESSQFVMLMADDLALQLGAQIYGAVPDVFVSADGHKKSISAPGIGNYVTLGKITSLVEKIIGSDALKQRTFIQAHGTSTPQNRVTESHVLNEVAKAFNIPAWKVSAVKCFLGHSQGTAGGDQLSTALGVWRYGLIPGIATINHVAEDVHRSNLSIQAEHYQVGNDGIDAVFLNSKGFGGNNASSAVLAPHIALRMLERKHGQAAMHAFRDRQQQTQAQAEQYDQACSRGETRPLYLFGHNVLEGEDLQIDAKSIRLPGYLNPINLDEENPYGDMS
ncbi:beta-ketoacyl synthase [Balneatrix alpica]|uniref:Beta-ketoacyl synthase n=1 Tax=Balneatrix alpica TaxID=75684 RepID=A0ABV5ZCY0_9GAMM|nr:beta-ketoacyl synthase [Balneatrix alpica]